MSLSSAIDYLSANTNEKMVIFKVRPNRMTDEYAEESLEVNGFIIGITPYHAKCLEKMSDDLSEQESFMLEGVDLDWGKIPGLCFCATVFEPEDKIFYGGDLVSMPATLGTVREFEKIAEERSAGFVVHKLLVDLKLKLVRFVIEGSNDPVMAGWVADLSWFARKISQTYEKLCRGNENA